MRCKHCQYSLANLTEHRCPECGREFDPRDPATFETADARRTHTRRWRLGVVAFLLWAIMMTPVIIFNVRHQSSQAGLLVITMAYLAAYWGFSIYRARPRS